MSEHPPLFRLDAIAAGDHDAGVEGHLSRCTTCASYVERLRAAVDDSVERARGASAEFVLALDEVQHSRARDPDSRTPSHRRRFAFAGVSLLAAAAGLVLVMQTGTPFGVADAGVTEPSIRFKGKLQLAVIRDRRGEQIRSATEVRVRPGDRLRAEISIDDARPVEVGFLGKDGTWVLLLAPALVEAGTYFSDRAAQFDETPTEGWIIAGRPDAVSRARAERSFIDVSAIPVVAEP